MTAGIAGDVVEILDIGIDAALPVLAGRDRSGADIDRVEIAMMNIFQRLVCGAAEVILLARLRAEAPYPAAQSAGTTQ